MDKRMLNILQEGKKDRFFKALYTFRDSSGDLHYVKAYLRADRSVFLMAENAEGEEVAYLGIYPHLNRRIFLDVIYTYTKFRGRKIASHMNEIAEHFLAENGYSGFLLRGVFEPTQMAGDRQNNVYCSAGELERRAEAFYHSRGYQIVALKDFQAHPEKYPNLTMRDDFELGEGDTEKIVAKTIQRLSMPDCVEDFVDVGKDAEKADGL